MYQPEPLPTSDESSYVSCNPCSVGARQVSLSSPSVSASAPATASTPVSAIDELAASLAAVDLAALTRAAAAPVDGALLDRFVESVEVGHMHASSLSASNKGLLFAKDSVCVVLCWYVHVALPGAWNGASTHVKINCLFL